MEVNGDSVTEYDTVENGCMKVDTSMTERKDY